MGDRRSFSALKMEAGGLHWKRIGGEDWERLPRKRGDPKVTILALHALGGWACGGAGRAVLGPQANEQEQKGLADPLTRWLK